MSLQQAITIGRCTARGATAILLALATFALAGVASGQIPFPDGFSPPRDAQPPKPAVAPSEPPIVTRQTAFSIPFAIRQDQAAAGAPEVHLYLSTDQGATWRLHESKRQAEGYFDFRAAGDGEYWFLSRTSNAGPPSAPERGAAPELTVIVDTRSPQLEFDAVVAPSGEVNATWKAADPALKPDTFKVEYRAVVGSEAQGWQPVSIEPNSTAAAAGAFSGNSSWRPATSARVIYVRAEIQDQAGNPAVATRQVYLPRVASRRDPQNPNSPAATDLAARPAPSLGAAPWTDNNVDPKPGLPVNIARLPSTDSANPGVAGAATATSAPLAGRYPSTLPSTTQSPASPTAPSDTGRFSRFEPNRSPSDREFGANQYQPVRGPVHPPVSDQLIDENGATSAPPLADSPTAYGPPPGEQVQQTNSLAFQLDYDVDAVGPQGVAEVELWGTTDGGRTWTRWATDPDRTSPFDVNVEKEGEFGFRIVVVGKNGLAGQAPRTGDAADLWVGVDVTQPTGALTSAIYGDGERAGMLDIQWSAEDANLGEHPITLQYASQSGGPWTTIAAGLENSGGYAWRIDPRVPQQVYLRLEVRDQAGNLLAHELRDPISTAGLVPKARIRSVRPAR